VTPRIGGAWPCLWGSPLLWSNLAGQREACAMLVVNSVTIGDLRDEWLDGFGLVF